MTIWQDFAARHGLQGQTHLVDEWLEPNAATGVEQWWIITVVTPAGAILQEDVRTGASHRPCPFDVALSWFAYSDYRPRSLRFGSTDRRRRLKNAAF